MRVIGGTARGTKLLAVPGDTTRPILDRVKTALFDILRPEISDIDLFLDLFSGSGGVAIEALSQGAKRAIMLDIEEAAVRTIHSNLEKTHLTDRAEVRKEDAFSYLKKTSKQFSLIYIAPPQFLGIWLEALKAVAERPSLLTPGGQVIVQISPEEEEPFHSPVLRQESSRTYGKTTLLFFRKQGE